jgi:UDP-N-acetylmuramoylalanine--D-glutamate ligase
MLNVPQYQGSRIAVFGLGRSGLVSARALRESGAEVLVWDDNETRRAEAEAEGFAVKDLYSGDWHGIEALLLSPGVPLTHPEPHDVVKRAKKLNVPVIGDIELFQMALDAAETEVPFIAITGTNGKSTTTALIGHMAAFCGRDAQVGGNIGKPVLELAAPRPNTVYVIEISSYQIDLAPHLHPSIGILTNITPDHIDRHGSLDGYAAVKEKLFARQAAGDDAMLGIDTPASAQICSRLLGKGLQRVVPVSVGKAIGRGIYVLDGVLYDNTGTQCVTVGNLKPMKTLAGAHNWQNAAIAYAVGRSLGFPRDRILDSFESFAGLAHRMEIVAEEAGVRFVNDSKATNADAAEKSLGTYDNIYWIAGGVAKEGGIAPLEPFFPRIRKAYLIGQAAEAFAETLKGKVETVLAGTLGSAVAKAHTDAASDAAPMDKVVLLAPACASFDQFANFEERGDSFRKAVLARLGKAEAGTAGEVTP